MNFYAVVFLLCPPDLLRCEPFFERRDPCKTLGKWCPHNGVAIANHCAIVNLLRVVNLLWRSIFSTAGSFGIVSDAERIAVRWRFSIAKKSLASWGLNESCDHSSGRGKNRHRNRRDSRDSGPLKHYAADKIGRHFGPSPAPKYSKDPSVLKILRRANSLRREKNATAIAKRYGECSEVLVFLGKNRQENGTESEKLRR